MNAAAGRFWSATTRGRHSQEPHPQGPPLPGAATPRVHHYIRYLNISPRIHFQPQDVENLKENGEYISCASIEAGLTRMLLCRSLVDYNNSLGK